MTRDEIVAIIKQRMGNYNGDEIDAHIVTEIKLNQIIMEQEASLPWFLLHSATARGSADSGNLLEPLVSTRDSIDCNFLAESEDFALGTYLDGNGETCDDVSLMDKADVLRWAKVNKAGNYDENCYGHPAYYTQHIGAPLGYFLVAPAPSVDWTLIGTSYYADIPLDTDSTNLWLTYAPDLVIGKVGVIIAGQYTMLEKFVPAFGAQAKIAEERLMKLNALKSEENIRRLMGDS